MAEILKGNVVAAQIKEKMKKDIEELAKIGKVSTLGIVRLGNNPDDVSYEKSIIKNCETIGIKSQVFEKDLGMTTNELVEFMEELNQDNSISGVLVFRPLPKHIDEARIREALSPAKDVDCMHPLNLAKIFEGNMSGFTPCTPKAAMEILLYNNVELEGKNVVVVNRSMVLGKPLAMMLLEKNATVTICHSRTKNLHEITSKADVVVTALGKAKFFDKKYFNEKSICIDVGVSLDNEGKLSGDIDYPEVSEMVSMITPVPGGVGAVTTSLLLSHVVEACKRM
ncbi:bifunctional 5,10-methylenetetrahydrofolate dehydrogenase/5,10-methenyltetrahydrofolate cyclohydrolase [Tissierella praeacuta]|uniref:bifunctional 5,10-methylenetetrahydrofolate dehydrogenase/5,10-methenyltetrahydrofolate cyclohydrolase n=1 Tax=Tissierella praeacuta TaxID=43131 RepID=UPI002FDAC7E2